MFRYAAVSGGSVNSFPPPEGTNSYSAEIPLFRGKIMKSLGLFFHPPLKFLFKFSFFQRSSERCLLLVCFLFFVYLGLEFFKGLNSRSFLFFPMAPFLLPVILTILLAFQPHFDDRQSSCRTSKSHSVFFSPRRNVHTFFFAFFLHCIADRLLLKMPCLSPGQNLSFRFGLACGVLLVFLIFFGTGFYSFPFSG